jgi:putative hydrolase of the HAD superfamily
MMIFFDVDETLINQRKAEAAAAVHFLAAYGDRLPPYHSPAGFCLTWRALREWHLPPFLRGTISFREHRRRRIRDLFLDGAWLSDREADRRFDAFLHHYERSWSLFDDVLPALAALADHRLGVLSNGNGPQQRRKLQRTGILDRFEAVVISEDVGCAKPGCEIFHTACRSAGCNPEDCLYVGDRLDNDARAAAAAGLRGIWLNRGTPSDVDDVDSIHSLTELRPLLGNRRSNFALASFATEQ